MRILTSSLTYPLPNGATVSIDASIDGLIEKGDEVIIIGPRYKMLRHRPEHYQAPFSSMSKAVGRLVGKQERTFELTAFFYIKELAKEFKPDIYWLHSLAWPPNAFELHMLKSNKPKVLSYHTLVEEYGEMYGGKIGLDLMRRRSKKVANKMDAVIVPGNFIKERLIGYGVKKPIYIIPTGIAKVDNYLAKADLCGKFNIPKKAKIMLYVGRICKEKNIEALLGALKEIKDKEKDIFLLLVGPGEIEKFKKIAAKKKVANRVVFTGPFSSEETQKIYGGADVFVFPSKKTETQCLAVAEAMMAEVPVIALCRQSQSWVYPRDLFISVKSELDFPEAIPETLKNSEKNRKMVKNAKKFVLEKFSRERMIERQRKLFLNLCNKPRS